MRDKKKKNWIRIETEIKENFITISDVTQELKKVLTNEPNASIASIVRIVIQSNV